MSFLLALLATVAYALNNTLMAAYYRRIDAMLAVTLRGLGLALSMLPLLLIPSWHELLQIGGVWHLLAPAAGCALVGNWCAAKAYRYLPIGIAAALNMSTAILASAGYSFVLLDETLSPAQLGWMLLVVMGIVALGRAKIPAVENRTYHIPLGVLSCLGFGLSLGLGYTLIGRISRLVHPLVAGYCWETAIALLGLAALLLRSAALRTPVPLVSWPEVRTIVGYSVPAAIGTACYSLAVASGKVAIVTAILSTTMIASALFAWLLYRERLTRIQWVWMAIVSCLVIGLRLSGT